MKAACTRPTPNQAVLNLKYRQLPIEPDRHEKRARISSHVNGRRPAGTASRGHHACSCCCAPDKSSSIPPFTGRRCQEKPAFLLEKDQQNKTLCIGDTTHSLADGASRVYRGRNVKEPKQTRANLHRLGKGGVVLEQSPCVVLKLPLPAVADACAERGGGEKRKARANTLQVLPRPP